MHWRYCSLALNHRYDIWGLLWSLIISDFHMPSRSARFCEISSLLPLQWRHINVMMSPIMDNATVCQTASLLCHDVIPPLSGTYNMHIMLPGLRPPPPPPPPPPAGHAYFDVSLKFCVRLSHLIKHNVKTKWRYKISMTLNFNVTLRCHQLLSDKKAHVWWILIIWITEEIIDPFCMSTSFNSSHHRSITSKFVTPTALHRV